MYFTADSVFVSSESAIIKSELCGPWLHVLDVLVIFLWLKHKKVEMK